MSAADFYTSTVEPTVAEFLADVQNARRARLAAIVLYHMADYVALEDYTGQDRRMMTELIENVREGLISRCPDFSLIRDVADSTKHAQLSVSKKVPRELSSSTQLTSSPGLFHSPFGEGVFAEASIVFAVLDNGKHKPLEPAIRSVMTEFKASYGLAMEMGD